MQELSSRSNPTIQAARSLQTAKGREAMGAFLLDGEHMVAEALAACPDKIRQLFVTAGKAEQFAPLIARAKDAEVFSVPQHVLEAISQVKTPQGIAAVCELPPDRAIEGMGDKLLLLDGVQDPGNVGTIMRTLDAAGFDGAIMTRGCADPYSPKVLRATMGSIFRVQIARCEDALGAMEQLHTSGYETVATALGGEPFYERTALPSRICVLIGNEGAGLSREAISAAKRSYSLPMRGGAESLNAGIAAAVVMYDLMNR